MQEDIKNINKGILLTILILGCFLSTLNQTLLNVALSNLMDVFDVTAATVQWISTGFMLVNGILIPITAYLMKRFTTRQLFISAMSFLFDRFSHLRGGAKLCCALVRTDGPSSRCRNRDAPHDECCARHLSR